MRHRTHFASFSHQLCSNDFGVHNYVGSQLFKCDAIKVAPHL